MRQNNDNKDILLGLVIMVIVIGVVLTLHFTLPKTRVDKNCVKISKNMKYCEETLGKKKLCFTKITDDKFVGFGIMKLGCEGFDKTFITLVRHQLKIYKKYNNN